MTMNILVLIKAVPMETEAKMTEEFLIDREKTQLNLNISDESAVEAALKLGANVTVLSMGTLQAESVLKDLLARGVAEAVLVSDRRIAGSDTFATATVLSKALEKLMAETPFDAVFCGRRAMDGETGQVPPELAAKLGLPCITNASKVEKVENSLIVTRTVEDGEEVLTVGSPVVVSFTEYSHHLRLAGILGRRNAMKKEVRKLDLADIGLSEEACGVKGSLTKVLRVNVLENGKRKGPRTEDPEEGASWILKAVEEGKA